MSGSQIADAWQAGKNDVVLVSRHGPVLVLSIDPVRPGLFLFDRDQLPDRTISPFTDLLRARIKGTTMTKIQIPVPGERVLKITFAAAWPAKESTPLNIVIEVMGRRSNLMILENNRILHPLRVVPKEKSRARPVVAGEAYHLPPPRGGIPVEEITARDLQAAGPLSDGVLLNTVSGISPFTTAQAFLRLDPGSSEETGAQALAAALQEMVSSSTGDTGYVHRSGGKVNVSPFEPLPMDRSDSIDRYSPFSKAAARWKRTDFEAAVGTTNDAAALGKRLLKLIGRINNTLDQMDREEERCKAHNDVRVMAEALLIHAAEIKQGANTVTLPDPYDPGLKITIGLDTTKSPQLNANDLFSKARRLKRGLQEVGVRREKLEQEKKDVQLALQTLNDRGDPEPARKILDLTSPGTFAKGKAVQYSYSGPGRKHTVDGFTILVGKSSTDNERVTFKAAGPGDLWLHARDYPGSHVVILAGKKQVPDKVLYAAANLAAAGSGARNDTAPEIMVTERKWVRKLKGGKPGQVTVERFKTIRPRKSEV